jgi:predicted nucleic-acid-binding Zn-ribbon protein
LENLWKFKCMRCGHEYEEKYDPRAPLVERSCPKCRSNSVRPLAAKDAPGAK